jgi:uncharacterized protein (TIGR02217 family)
MLEFDEIRFPEDISYGAIGGPEYSTNVVFTTNGKEYRNINSLSSKMRYNISYEVKTNTQIEKLLAFFRARNGKAIGFRFKDVCDYKAEMELLGIGDGTRQTFQLQKIYQSGESAYIRTIHKPVIGSVKLYIDNQECNLGAAINHQSGEITFDAAIPIGAEVFASFEFDVPVRFDIDYLPISVDEANTYSIKNINLIEIKL